MTLNEWATHHRDAIIAEDASPSAIPSLVAVINREIADAEGVPSDDGRLEHAFAACVTAARAALSANGYRIRSSAHHYLAIESLHYTLKLSRDEVNRLQTYRRMRARARYDQVGIISREDARAVLAAAKNLADRLKGWLTQEHPDFLLR